MMMVVQSVVRAALVVALGCSLAACGGGGGGGGGGGSTGGGTANQPPRFSSDTDFVFAENTEVRFTLEVTDPDSTTVTISEVAGGDGGLFILDASSGVITANTPNGSFDFENPEDRDGNNVYEQDVQLSDGTNTVIETITITISDVDEAPEFAQQPEFQLNENQTGVIVTFTAVDPEGESVSDYQLYEVSKLGEVVNADRLVEAFSVDAATGELSVVVPFDAETEGTQDLISVTVSATDGVNQGFGGVAIRIVDLPSRIGDAVRISGVDALSPLADTVSRVGDLDGDGVNEVFVATSTPLDDFDRGFLLWGASLRESLAANSDTLISDLTVNEKVAFVGDDRLDGGARISRMTGVDVGDIDNDGRDDLLILMRREANSIDDLDIDNGALAYVIWGSALERGTTETVSLTALSPTEGVSLTGLIRRSAVDTVGTGADFDGDNRADVVIGNPQLNRSMVIFGDALTAAGGNLDLGTATNSQLVELRSEVPGRGIIEQTGGRLAVMADITSDGVPELILAGEGLEPNFQSGAFVVSGALIAGAKGVANVVNVSDVANDTSVVEVSVVETTTSSLAADGDADGDSVMDLAIGHRSNAEVPRIATVVYGATIAAAFGTTEEIDLNFSGTVDGVVISDTGSIAAQSIDVDPVAVRWIGDADGVIGDELMVSVPNETSLGRFESGQLYVFTNANLTAAVGDLQFDSTTPDATSVTVLRGYAANVRTGRDLMAIDLDGDLALEIGTGAITAGSEAAGLDNGGLVIFSGSIVSDALATAAGDSDLATSVVVEAP